MFDILVIIGGLFWVYCGVKYFGLIMNTHVENTFGYIKNTFLVFISVSIILFGFFIIGITSKPYIETYISQYIS